MTFASPDRRALRLLSARAENNPPEEIHEGSGYKLNKPIDLFGVLH